jgi:hypothetical protein
VPDISGARSEDDLSYCHAASSWKCVPAPDPEAEVGKRVLPLF